MRIERVGKCCGSRGSLGAIDFQPHAEPRSVHRLATASTTEVQIWALWRPEGNGVSKEPLKCLCIYTFKGHAPHEVATVRWSPNGKYLASTDSGGVTYILERNREKSWSLETSLKHAVERNSGNIDTLASEPVQPTIIKETKKYTFKYDGTSSKRTKANADPATKDSGSKSTRISFDSQSVHQEVVKPTTIENCGGNYEVWTSMQPMRCPAKMGQLFDISWAPDNRSIVGGGLNGQVAVFDIHTKQVVAQFDVFEGIYAESAYNLRGYVKSVAWDPMTLYIAVQTNNRQVSVWRRSPPHPKNAPYKWTFKRVLYDDQLFKKMQNDVLGGSRISWTPNGQAVAFPNGGVENTNFAACFEVVHADISKHSDLIVDGKVDSTRLQFVYDIADHNVRPDPMLLRGHESRVRNVRFSQDLLVSHKRGLCKGGTFADSDRFIFYAQTSDDGVISIWRFKQSSNWHSHYKNEAQCICVIQNAMDEQSSIEDLSWGNSGKWLAIAASHGGLILIEMGEDETYTRYRSNWMHGIGVEDTHELTSKFVENIEKYAATKEEQSKGNDVISWMANSNGSGNNANVLHTALGQVGTCRNANQAKVESTGAIFNTYQLERFKTGFAYLPLAPERKGCNGYRAKYAMMDQSIMCIVLTIFKALEGLALGYGVIMYALGTYFKQTLNMLHQGKRCRGSANGSHRIRDMRCTGDSVALCLPSGVTVTAAAISSCLVDSIESVDLIRGDYCSSGMYLHEELLRPRSFKKRYAGIGCSVAAVHTLMDVNSTSDSDTREVGMSSSVNDNLETSDHGQNAVQGGMAENGIGGDVRMDASKETDTLPQCLEAMNDENVVEGAPLSGNSLPPREKQLGNQEQVKRSQRKQKRHRSIVDTENAVVDIWLNMDYSQVEDLLAQYWKHQKEQETSPKAVKKMPEMIDEVGDVPVASRKRFALPKAIFKKPTKVATMPPKSIADKHKNDTHVDNFFEVPFVRPAFSVIVSSSEGRRKIFALNNAHDDIPASISCVDVTSDLLNVKWMKSVAEGYITHVSAIKDTGLVMVVSQIGDLVHQSDESTYMKRKWSRDHSIVRHMDGMGIRKCHINRESASFITVIDCHTGRTVLGPCEIPDLNVSNVSVLASSNRIYATFTATNGTISLYSLGRLTERENARFNFMFACSIDSILPRERYSDIMQIQLLNVTQNAAMDGDAHMPCTGHGMPTTSQEGDGIYVHSDGMSAGIMHSFDDTATYRKDCLKNWDATDTPTNMAQPARQAPLAWHYTSSGHLGQSASNDEETKHLPATSFDTNLLMDSELDINMYAIMVYLRDPEVYVFTKHYWPVPLELVKDFTGVNSVKQPKKMLSLRSIGGVYQNKLHPEQSSKHKESSTLFTNLLHRLVDVFQLNNLIKDEYRPSGIIERSTRDEVAEKQRFMLSSLIIGSRTEYIMYLYDYVRHIVRHLCVQEIADALTKLYKTAIDAGIKGWDDVPVEFTCFDARMMSTLGIDVITILRQFIVPLLNSLCFIIHQECRDRDMNPLEEPVTYTNTEGETQCHKYCAATCPINDARDLIKDKVETTNDKLLNMREVTLA
ncbi:hypothetical protein X943_003283 [Babesia divergens]|uniref:Protein HIRA n=1 Tax=Babesia divergens TaxID=32595 RepID=A0AAD9LFD1_BABDI|nr:hypothetical protein X943_003283 [Babesia divergens]